MKILITGGAGFIGSALIRHIIADTGHAVLNIDKLTYAGNLDSLAGAVDSDRYQFRQIDICDRAALDAAFAGFQQEVEMYHSSLDHDECQANVT